MAEPVIKGWGADVPESIVSDCFDQPGPLPTGWSRLDGEIAAEDDDALVGVGGGPDGTANTCLHLIKFKNRSHRVGVVRSIEATAGRALTVVFDLATLRQGSDRLYRYNNDSDGFRVCLLTSASHEAVSVAIKGTAGAIGVSGADTGAVLPLLTWCSLRLSVDPGRQSCSLFVNGQLVYSGAVADIADEGFRGISFHLPDDPPAHLGMWVDRFAAYSGAAPPPEMPSCTPHPRPTPSAILPGDVTLTGLKPGATRVAGNIGARLNHAIYRNFMALDIESDFIQPFVEPFSAEAQPGEAFYGKFIGIGMLLEAAVRMAFYTGDPVVVARKDRLVACLMAAQHADGYLGVYPRWEDEAQLFTEFCFHDAAYIVEGLVRDALFFDSAESLSAAVKLADYILRNWHRRPQLPDFTTLGINEAFALLHGATGDRRYRDFILHEPCGKRRSIQNASLLDWDQQVWPGGHRERVSPDGGEAAERHAIVHVYRLYERCLFQLILNALGPDARLQSMPTRVLALLADADATGMLITGTSGVDEGWEDTQRCAGKVGETCTTVYGLWLFQQLLKATGDLRYGDTIERIIYNGLFAAQDPEGRRVRYFSPPSGRREYFGRDSYCCPNNFRKGMIRLPELVYYAWGNGFAVNLFEESEADIKVAGDTTVQVRQSTDYPVSGTSVITIHGLPAPRDFPVRIRIPAWCENATVTVNGSESGPLIDRRWHNGDRIEVHLPMVWRFVGGRRGQQGHAALMRGPVVYALSRTLNKLPDDMVLRDITLDTASIRTVGTDDRGVLNKPVCGVRAWSPARDPGAPPDLSLRLHEFPKPTAEEIYFRVNDPSWIVADELFAASMATRHKAGTTRKGSPP